ncbi:arylesterase [Vogesella sp. LYT5W]|uniref:Arylesterase n=1 Tax=Vogesella margarita TaxID=2984199 RepID=A0ABT5IPT8_9NEIS|nr:arylesterase [Vogesella margarita]MDC7714565.1 arylesterase [Vogesella margarita]
MLYRCFLLVVLLLAPHMAHAARIVVFGDSLSAAYGLRPEQGWVRLLQQQLGSTHQVINSSLSGETTAGGLARLPAVLRQQRPEVLILELGGNDGLRGLPLPAMQDNLSAMVRLAQRAGARVLLVGMALPPNYGPDYGAKFRQVYDKVARRHKVALVPLLVAGFEQDLALFQGDGIHPVAEAQPRMVRNVLPALTPLIARK